MTLFQNILVPNSLSQNISSHRFGLRDGLKFSAKGLGILGACLLLSGCQGGGGQSQIPNHGISPNPTQHQPKAEDLTAPFRFGGVGLEGRSAAHGSFKHLRLRSSALCANYCYNRHRREMNAGLPEEEIRALIRDCQGSCSNSSETPTLQSLPGPRRR